MNASQHVHYRASLSHLLVGRQYGAGPPSSLLQGNDKGFNPDFTDPYTQRCTPQKQSRLTDRKDSSGRQGRSAEYALRWQSVVAKSGRGAVKHCREKCTSSTPSDPLS